jgi:dTDP-4-dehydrorhamnose reductase
MKIVLTGANGFLANYVIQYLLQQNNVEIIAVGKGQSRLNFDNENIVYESLDFTDEKAVEELFAKHLPTHIIHAGAISKPDDCEANKDLAYKINVTGTKYLLENSQKNNCYFLFVSTDFVFDGIKGMYAEDDTVNPVNYYGQTKVWAEDEVKKYTSDWSIVRTVLVYGKPLSGRNNLVTLVKEKLEVGEEYSVFCDQWRTPTYVEDLAQAMVSMIMQQTTGIYHISGVDGLTPYDMAIATAKFLNLDEKLIKKVTAETFKQPALRPPTTGFNISKAKTVLGFKPVSFEEGLSKTLS